MIEIKLSEESSEAIENFIIESELLKELKDKFFEKWAIGNMSIKRAKEYDLIITEWEKDTKKAFLNMCESISKDIERRAFRADCWKRG